jgi:mRNA interferase MazF
MSPHYVPDAGDVVWLRFDPQAGHEQAGHRPALVISPSAYNAKTHLMLCCPMTTKVKGYPFEVRIAGDRPAAVLADQVKSLDWVARRAQHKGKVSAAELRETRAKILALVGSSDDP